MRTLVLLLMSCFLLTAAVPAASARLVTCDNANPTPPCVGQATLGAIGFCVWPSSSATCAYVANQGASGSCLYTSSNGAQQRLACQPSGGCDNAHPNPPCFGWATLGAVGGCAWVLSGVAVCVYEADQHHGAGNCYYVSSLGGQQTLLCDQQVGL